MGGIGSGRHPTLDKKQIVENCLRLNVSNLCSRTRAEPGQTGLIQWTWGRTIRSTIEYEFRTGPQSDRTLVLKYRDGATNNPVRLPVLLTTTTPRLGGVCWWATCPLITADGRCARRVRMLYAPPRTPFFGCRHCHELTYRSSQTAHSGDSVVCAFADDHGVDLRKARRMMREAFL